MVFRGTNSRCEALEGTDCSTSKAIRKQVYMLVAGGAEAEQVGSCYFGLLVRMRYTAVSLEEF